MVCCLYCSACRKKVRERFQQSGIEHYLPVQMVTRKWHDRLKKVEQPVLTGYIFVRILPEEASKVLMTYGAIAFVREQSRPAVIPDSQIERPSSNGGECQMKS